MVQDASKSFGLEETLKAVKAGNADAKYSDLWGANNPVQHGRGGDPKHIAKYIEACFSGNTLWPSGSAQVIDGNITYSLHEQNKRVDGSFSAPGTSGVNMHQLKDLSGRPISDEVKAELVTNQKTFAAAMAAMAEAKGDQ